MSMDDRDSSLDKKRGSDKKPEIQSPKEQGIESGISKTPDQLQLRETLLEEVEQIPLREQENQQEVFQALLQAQKQDKIGVILEGGTGSGKSAFGPHILMQALKQIDDLPEKIRMMEPTRTATKETAQSAASVMGEVAFGENAGYWMSGDKTITSHDEIDFEVLTQGIFKFKVLDGEYNSSEVGGLILDELHEDTVDYQLVMGVLKYLHENSPEDVPLVLFSSATIKQEEIRQHFNLDPEHSIEVQPEQETSVETNFIEEEGTTHSQRRRYTSLAASKVLDQIDQGRDGDILVFMPGYSEIERTIESIKSRLDSRGIDQDQIEVVSLHGQTTSREEFNKIASGKDKEAKTRVIVSTNVAETSLTIPDLTTVVDSCRRKNIYFDPDTGIEELRTSLSSKFELEQAKGRIGRGQATQDETPRYCPLITKEQYEDLDETPPSEFRLGDLSSNLIEIIEVIDWLDMDVEPDEFIEEYIFADVPEEKVKNHLNLLRELNIIDENNELTQEGEKIKELPFNIRISKMIQETRERNSEIEGTNFESIGLLLGAVSRSKGIVQPEVSDEVLRDRGLDPDSVTKERKRGLAKERHREAGFYDRGGEDSDWIRDLNIISSALDFAETRSSIEVFKGSSGEQNLSSLQDLRDRGTASKYLRQWCKANQVEFDSLQQVISTFISKYTEHANSRVNFEDVSDDIDTLLEEHREELDLAIASAYPDMILRRSKPHVWKLLGQGKDVYMNPVKTVGLKDQTEEETELCITGRITQGQGAKGSGTNYAELIHSVDAEVINEVAPERVELRSLISNPIRFDEEEGCMVKIYRASINSKKVGEVKESLEPGEEVSKRFAEEIYDGNTNLLTNHELEKNEEVYRSVRELYEKSGGSVFSDFMRKLNLPHESNTDKRRKAIKSSKQRIKDDLVSFYYQRLADLGHPTEIGEIEDKKDLFLLYDNLSKEEFEKKKEEVGSKYPDSIEVEELEIDLDYHYIASSEEHIVDLEIPKEGDDIVVTNKEQIPDDIGPSDDSPDIRYKYKKGVNNVEYIDSLDKLEQEVRDRHFRYNYDLPDKKEMDISVESGLPSFEKLVEEHGTFEYSENGLEAYPTIEVSSGKYVGDDLEFYLIYKKDRQTAKEAYEDAKSELEDMRELNEEVEQLYVSWDNTKEILSNLEEEAEELGIEKDLLFGLTDKYTPGRFRRNKRKIDRILGNKTKQRKLDSARKKVNRINAAVDEIKREWKYRKKKLPRARRKFRQTFSDEEISEIQNNRGSKWSIARDVISDIKSLLALNDGETDTMINPDEALDAIDDLQNILGSEGPSVNRTRSNEVYSDETSVKSGLFGTQMEQKLEGVSALGNDPKSDETGLESESSSVSREERPQEKVEQPQELTEEHKQKVRDLKHRLESLKNTYKVLAISTDKYEELSEHLDRIAEEDIENVENNLENIEQELDEIDQKQKEFEQQLQEARSEFAEKRKYFEQNIQGKETDLFHEIQYLLGIKEDEDYEIDYESAREKMQQLEQRIEKRQEQEKKYNPEDKKEIENNIFLFKKIVKALYSLDAEIKNPDSVSAQKKRQFKKYRGKSDNNLEDTQKNYEISKDESDPLYTPESIRGQLKNNVEDKIKLALDSDIGPYVVKDFKESWLTEIKEFYPEMDKVNEIVENNDEVKMYMEVRAQELDDTSLNELEQKVVNQVKENIKDNLEQIILKFIKNQDLDTYIKEEVINTIEKID
ncbi:MAG: helicase-related protein [Candidatus Paceibacteria bacterium]